MALIRVEEVADRAESGDEVIESSRSDPAEMGLQLGEGHLDRIEVWRVSREEQEPAACPAQGVRRSGHLVGGEVVEDHDRAGVQFGNELGLDPSGEGGTVHRALDHPGRDQGIRGQPGNEGLGPPAAEGSIHAQPLPDRRPAPEPCHVGFHAGLVDEHEPVRLRAHPRQPVPNPVPPGLADRRTPGLGGNQRLFLNLNPQRRRARLSEAGATCTPLASSSARASSGIVMSSLASTISRSKPR